MYEGGAVINKKRKDLYYLGSPKSCDEFLNGWMSGSGLLFKMPVPTILFSLKWCTCSLASNIS